MKLVPENFKLIPATYNGYDFMTIQYEDKDLVMKLKGEFQILETKTFGKLRLLFTPDDNETRRCWSVYLGVVMLGVF